MNPALSRGGFRANGARSTRRSLRAFTMLELMIVVAIMGIILLMGLPAIRSALKKEAFVQGLNNILDACEFARKQAVVYDQVMEMRIFPGERRIEVSAVPRDIPVDLSSSDAPPTPPPEDAPPPKSMKTYSADIPEQITIQELTVNFADLKQADIARIRFYPNGTSYMFYMGISSTGSGEDRYINLDEVTALPHVTTTPLE